MTLERVTFTGADDSTSISELIEISRQFPFVEWGILVPPRENKKRPSRFPLREWVHDFVGQAYCSDIHVQMAAHICPPWTELLLRGDCYDATELIGRAFDRVQINTHAAHYEYSEDWTRRLAGDEAREYILQLDGPNTERAREASGTLNVSGLYDLSHGAGVLPENWRQDQDFDFDWVGFAGGLGPQNLAVELPKIIACAGDMPFWIDMETHVRTDGCFDLRKVRQCIDIAAPFVHGFDTIRRDL